MVIYMIGEYFYVPFKKIDKKVLFLHEIAIFLVWYLCQIDLNL